MEWINCKKRLPDSGDEFNVVWDLEDGYREPVVTTMEFDAIKKVWVDKETKFEYTDTILMWQPLPSLPPVKVYRSENEMRIGEQQCSFCGWFKDDHRNGRCYHYSDESEDYFYSDRFFTSTT